MLKTRTTLKLLSTLALATAVVVGTAFGSSEAQGDRQGGKPAPKQPAAAADGDKQPDAKEGRQIPHGPVPGQQLPSRDDLARYVGRWRVGSAKQHTGRESIISWQWAAGNAGVMIDLYFPGADGSDGPSATHGLLAYNPGSGRIEVTSVGGNGDFLRGTVFTDGRTHEWVWDSWSISSPGKATNFRQVITFAEDGKSYTCVAFARRGLEWAKAFESKFFKLEDGE